MERTKTAIIEAFQQALEETPINKITIKNIVERCGINRNTFYYYFNGIPELMECHMTSMADQLINSMDQLDSTNELHQINQYFIQRKKAVLHVYRYYPREDFIRFLNKIAMYTVDKFIRRVTIGMDVPETDLSLLIHFYKCFLVGVLLDWLDDNMNYNLDAMVTRLGQLIGGSVQQTVEKRLQTQTE